MSTKCHSLSQEVATLKAQSPTSPPMAQPAAPEPALTASGDFTMQNTVTPAAAKPTQVLASLLEQFTSESMFAADLGDSDEDEDIISVSHVDSSFLATDVPLAPEAMREMAALEEAHADADSESSEEVKAPVVRWISWNEKDEEQSMTTWWKILEEVQMNKSVSYHTTMKVLVFTAVCGTGPA